ncbi:hypothetical protein H9Y04_40890 [Streptomyces sp. TRM66268-LWL]|uniref:Helix-turn-helix domain-containing protein n=1 Tax=Streptomyces polyasparticus TaxID=2767826 RepID=A0ABR7SWD6_9ACTN|nr:hypothetical protein [Streptomyces polyasparticus]MBC9718902.1 hypothetical protein [Streptomyces polyasparticus]
MNGLEVRLLLDTGPTAGEVAELRRRFDALGMSATAEGHSYGGPPPTSAFLIVVNAPLSPFLDRFAQQPGGAERLRSLVAHLLSLRADSRRWGRPHGVRLEDAATGLAVSLTHELPREAYTALLTADLSAFDHGSSPMDVRWDVRLARWSAHFTTSPVAVARRLPLRRGEAAAEPAARGLDEQRTRELWQLVERSGSAVAWQRASIVLWNRLGWSTCAIATRTLVSKDRIRAVIRNFNRDGFDSFRIGYGEGEPVAPTAAEEREAAAVVRSSPRDFAVERESWDATSLAECLVGSGIADDVDPKWLETLLADS